MDLYQETGKMALGSRLRRLSDVVTADAQRLFELYNVDFEPRWFPVFYVLSKNDAQSVTAIADQIGQPHPVVSMIVKEMTKRGLTSTKKSREDGRVTLVRLSKKGKSLIPALGEQCQDVAIAVDELLDEMQYDLWKAIEEAEFLLKQRDLFSRVVKVRKTRESQQVEISDFKPADAADFKRLNIEWIEKYFTVEPADLKTLDHPQVNVLDPGGAIVMARYKGEVVGTCALVKISDVDFELAKMAVTPASQGLGIGRLLGEAVIERARDCGAKRVLIQTNTSLEAAIGLYSKLGFQRIIGTPSPYAKCNIQMELLL